MRIPCLSLVAVSLFLTLFFGHPSARADEIENEGRALIGNGFNFSFKEVSPGIYRGGTPNQKGLDFLKSKGFKVIVTLENHNVKSEKAMVEARGMTFRHCPWSVIKLPVGPGPVKDADVSRALDAMANVSGRPVYIHCLGGEDRTGVMVGLYRVFYEGVSPEQARKEMYREGLKKNMMGWLDQYFDTYIKRHRSEIRKAE